MAKDKELADHERAHDGTPGMKVRHGADMSGKHFLKARRFGFHEPYGYSANQSSTARQNDAAGFVDYGKDEWPSKSQMLVPKK